MTTITIPKTLTNKGELIVIPRKDYRLILKLLKKGLQRENIDANLVESLKEIKKKKIIGPFSNAFDLMKSLEK